jgi:hypothetical protein
MRAAFVALEARLAELEARMRTQDEGPASAFSAWSGSEEAAGSRPASPTSLRP